MAATKAFVNASVVLSFGNLFESALNVIGANPVLAAQVHYDRPPEGLARGKWPAPKWLIGAVGAVLIVSAFIYLFLRIRRASRGKG